MSLTHPMLRWSSLNKVLLGPVPKNRKPKFDLTLKIIDLTNIPLVCGTVSVKWHLPSSNAAEHRGKTDKALIREHKATWDYSKELPLRLTIEKTQALSECAIHFEILQEYHDGGRGGRVHLGNVKLNLAEYAKLPEIRADEADGDEITRRYLMQDSKVNATLKIGIKMKQTEGDTGFTVPPLKSAMVTAGIAGIVTAEPGETDDMPTITSKTRELSEAQDIYRRTLAATWACQAGELPPDRLIEDLFAGGNGGRMEPPAMSQKLDRAIKFHSRDDSVGANSSDTDSKRTVTQTRLSPDMARPGHRRGGSAYDASNSFTSQTSTVSGRTSIEQQVQHIHGVQRRRGQNEYQELSEYDLRDDLKSWEVAVK